MKASTIEKVKAMMENADLDHDRARELLGGRGELPDAVAVALLALDRRFAALLHAIFDGDIDE